MACSYIYGRKGRHVCGFMCGNEVPASQVSPSAVLRHQWLSGWVAAADEIGPCDGRRRCYLPSSLCQREGVTEDDVFAGNSSAGMRNVALEVAATAKASAERSLRPRDGCKLLSILGADARATCRQCAATSRQAIRCDIPTCIHASLLVARRSVRC